MIAFLLALSVILSVPTANKPETGRYPDCTHELVSDDALWVRKAERAFGTPKAVHLFKQAVWAVHKEFGGAHRLPVGDLSYRGGGPIKPHRSHRDGRDIDVGYYFKDGRFRKWFGKPKTAHLDVARQWALFKTLIDTGEVEYLFVDYRLQRVLHRHALKHGETKRSLRKLMQWPRHYKKKWGIIRYEHGHDDHFHVRFKR
jgi:murein endopeptidase